MNMKSTSKSNQRKSKKLILAGVAISFSFAAGNASAIFGAGDTVIEVGPSWLQHTLNQINTYTQSMQDYAEYGEQGMRWRNTLSHYQQQLINLQHAINSFGMPTSLNMTKIPDDYGVAQRCGGGFSLANIIQGFSLSSSGNLIEQRKKICASIQIAANKKYNETIEFTKKTLPELQTALSKNNKRRDSSKDEGVMQASQYDALNYANAFDTEYKGWQMRMQTYDAYIESMQEQQKQLTELGLKGEQSPLGALVKTASLKAALEIGD